MRQEAANTAIRKALLEYEERHGYRGPEGSAGSTDFANEVTALSSVGNVPAGIVTAVEDKSISVLVKDVGSISIEWGGLKWARKHISENRMGRQPKKAADVAKIGDIVRVRQTEDGWRLTHLPAVEGALVSLDPMDGAVVALTGGFDFFRSKFNRATQAQRQPGSSFKPFVYSAALSKGFTPASFINDAPVVFDDPSLEGDWRPENYSGKFFGPTRMREALYKSRNLVSIRLLRSIGIDYAVDYMGRFGLPVERLPRNLSLALGSGALSPIEVATGYAVLYPMAVIG